MWVKINKQLVNLPDEEAKALIQAGQAKQVDPPKQRKIHTRA